MIFEFELKKWCHLPRGTRWKISNTWSLLKLTMMTKCMESDTLGKGKNRDFGISGSWRHYRSHQSLFRLVADREEYKMLTANLQDWSGTRRTRRSSSYNFITDFLFLIVSIASLHRNIWCLKTQDFTVFLYNQKVIFYFLFLNLSLMPEESNLLNLLAKLELTPLQNKTI